MPQLHQQLSLASPIHFLPKLFSTGRTSSSFTTEEQVQPHSYNYYVLLYHSCNHCFCFYLQIIIICLTFHSCCCCSRHTDSQKYKIKKSENLKVLDSKPGVYTQYKPFLQKDKALIKKLLRGIQTKRPGEVQTALLKRHLMDLTESFMIPLERYIASLMPLQKNISPFKVYKFSFIAIEL